MQKQGKQQRYIKELNLARALGVSKEAIKGMEQRGEIPQSIRISQRIRVFDKQQVEQVLGVVL